jgi:ferredoxin-NADP reductase
VSAPRLPALKVRVLSITPAAERIVEIRLEAVDGEALPSWTPGSHIDVFLDADLVRQYSLCSSPDETTWRLGVLEEVAGRGGSHHVHHRLRVGDVLEVSHPRNNFLLVLTERPIIFVSGGIGITPLLPMVHATQAAGADWRMLHLVRDERSSAFDAELAPYAENIVRHVDAVSGVVDLVAALDALGGSDADVYACGPGGLLDAIEAYVAARPRSTAHIERFTSTTPAIQEGDHAFVVEIADGTEIEVAADRTILQALNDAGIRTLSSCQEGVCGTCETAVLLGVPDHRDHVLGDDERAAGDVMMPCVSRCLGDRLVLDL